MKEVVKMDYKEFNKEQRRKDRERHKCITDVDKDKASIKVSKQGLNVFGVVFKDRPIYEQLDLKLH